jgi:hypothetical protein
MNFEREHEGLGATEAGVISSGSENHEVLSEAKSRRRGLLRDLASPSYGSRYRSK